jgi:hypothetical protein
MQPLHACARSHASSSSCCLGEGSLDPLPLVTSSALLSLDELDDDHGAIPAQCASAYPGRCLKQCQAVLSAVTGYTMGCYGQPMSATISGQAQPPQRRFPQAAMVSASDVAG